MIDYQFASLPHGWKVKLLKDVTTFLDEQRVPIKQSDRISIEGKYPYYGASGIIDYVNDYIFDGDYILLGEDGANILSRSSPLAFRVSGKIWVNNHAHVLEPKSMMDIGFLTEYLESISYAKYNTGTAQPKLPQSTCSKIEVIVPPLPEQRKIAEILSVWDEAITYTERLIVALQQRKKCLMQLLLTGQIRFAGFEKSKETQPTKFGEIPADWGYVPIAKVAEQASEKNNKGDDLPVLSCTKHNGLVDSLTYFGRQIFSEDTSTYKIVKRCQFAYATNHIEEGSIGYQDLYERALISPMYTVFETTGKIDNRYLYLVLKTETYRQIFEQNTSASVNRRGSLRWKEFSRIEIPLPKIEEQRRIADLADSCDHELALQRRKLEALKQQKTGLMQQLLTGRIRVKVD